MENSRNNQDRTRLSGVTIAILATDGFEQSELEKPREMLEAAGAKTVLIAPKAGTIQGYHHHDKGDSFEVELTLDQANAQDYDALLLPGGALNPDALRMVPKAVELVRTFSRAHKLVAAICHGPWLLVEADVVEGREVTSWPSIKTDLTNAGAEWVDREVVSDGGIVTSRKPEDIPAFVAKLVELLTPQQPTREASHSVTH